MGEELFTVAVLFGGLIGMPLGWVAHKAREAARIRGKTLVIGLDPDRRDLIQRYIRPTDEGKLLWPRGPENGEIQLGSGASWTLDGEGRAFIINRDTLAAYNAEEANLNMAPDDGWAIAKRMLGIHEKNVALSAGRSWLDELVKYTVPMLIVLTIIVLAGFAIIAGGV